MRDLYDVKYGQDMLDHIRSLNNTEKCLELQSAQHTANAMHQLNTLLMQERGNYHDVLSVTMPENAYCLELPSYSDADGCVIVTNHVSLAMWKLRFIRKFGNLKLERSMRDIDIPLAEAETRNAMNPRYKVAGNGVEYFKWVDRYNEAKGSWCDKNTAE